MSCVVLDSMLIFVISAPAVTNNDELYSAHLTNTRITTDQLSDQPNAYPVYEYNYRPSAAKELDDAALLNALHDATGAEITNISIPIQFRSLVEIPIQSLPFDRWCVGVVL